MGQEHDTSEADTSDSAARADTNDPMMKEFGAEVVTISLKQKLQALTNNKFHSLQRSKLFQKSSDYLNAKASETKIWIG